MAGGIEAAVSGTDAAMFFGIRAGSAEMPAGDTQVGEIGELDPDGAWANEGDNIVRAGRRSTARLVSGQAVVDQLLRHRRERLAPFRDDGKGGLEGFALHPGRRRFPFVGWFPPIQALTGLSRQ